MKIRLTFGLNEAKKEMSWWKPIREFPPLIRYKGKKWEFAIIDEDPSKQVDHICIFSEIQSYDPAWHSTQYVDLESLLGDTYGTKCECGALYTSFPQLHMFFCPKWTKY